MPGGHTPCLAHCTPVARIDTDTLDEAFRLTHNVERPWTRNSAIRLMPSAWNGARSTSVGDILVDDQGGQWLVEAHGFVALPHPRAVTPTP